LTATALYSRVVVAEGALTKEKDESNKLRTYLGQILHEIESKAPLIAQQRRDYERALIAHEELSRRLAATSRDAAQAAADLGAEKDARVRADALAASLQGEVADLKKQVLALIRAGKNAAHTNPGGDAFTLDDLSSSSANNASKQQQHHHLSTTTSSAVRSNGWPTTDAHLLQLAAQDDPAARDKLSEAAASAIIDESLLTYADVKELQERNQQLIRVLRLLARQLGKLSSSTNNGSSSSLDVSLGGSSSSSSSSSNSMMLGASGFGGSGIGFGPAGSSAREALVALHNELSELRASRERQSAMVATVAHQRDMYRMLLSQADSSLLAKGDANVGGGGGGDIVASSQQLTAGVSSPSGGAGPDTTTTRGAALGLSQLASSSSSARDNTSSRMAASSSSAVTAMAQATADNLQAMLDEARGELERTRSDARSAIKAAEARTEQLRNECVELNKTMIAAQGEARFQTERATQLQHSADASKEEASRELKRSLHLQVSITLTLLLCFHAPFSLLSL
jgi:nucleoprotein TPR